MIWIPVVNIIFLAIGIGWGRFARRRYGTDAFFAGAVLIAGVHIGVNTWLVFG